MSSDEEEASHVIVVEGIHRLGESPFLEVETSTTGSLPLRKRIFITSLARQVLRIRVSQVKKW